MLQERNRDKEKLLTHLYTHHDQWLATMDLACGKGCAACCTQSVTMTTLEGARIIAYLEHGGRGSELRNWWGATGKATGTVLPATTNAFARHCLAGETPADPVELEWDFTPCPFLADNLCSIYQVRPFGCRAMVSTTDCAISGYAEMAPWVLTTNTVFVQLIEHLDAGGFWGRMADILAYLSYEGNNAAQREALERALRPTEPIPGLLIPPDEEKAVQGILGRYLTDTVDGAAIGELMGLTPGQCDTE